MLAVPRQPLLQRRVVARRLLRVRLRLRLRLRFGGRRSPLPPRRHRVSSAEGRQDLATGGDGCGGRFGGEEPSTSRRGKFSNGVLAKSGGCGEERTAKSSVSERTSSPMNVTTAQCVTKRAHPSWPMHGMHRPSCFLLFFPFFLNFFPQKKKDVRCSSDELKNGGKGNMFMS